MRWQGSLLEGSGTIDSTTSGAFGGLGVTWKARSEDENGGLTSPEELIAAAHAACFSMALSAGLARADTPAEELRTSATVTFQPGEGITHIALDGRRRVSRASTTRRSEAAAEAREGELPGLEGACGCPRDQPGQPASAS